MAYQNGHWVSAAHLRVSIADPAVTQGVSAVERIRAYRGKLFQVETHLQRWKQSTEVLRVAKLPNRDELLSLIDQTLQKNRAWIAGNENFGVLLLASPGVQGKATFVIDLYAIDEQLIQRRTTSGMPLVVTDVMQPDPSCWPRNIKVRSRLHYYLADQFAQDQDPDAIGVLLDNDGTITETSIANVLIVENGCLVSPFIERILFGVSMQAVVKIAADLKLDWLQEPISPERMSRADEVLLTGSSCGIWFANRIDGQATPSNRPVYQSLRKGFDQLIGKSR
ncbi:aminotransferase class IV [Stieleria sp. JC731]|uniref:aminotransferase class IV n=1 Tax=Stieleria sp. JC731 TaxID=2894195 RepID=UPI001E2AC14A|nr:aminotransferase class IV [Stieleria sp. JC731]MCC9601381.1 aminotransferase class IV [Stieleria sp. JC731]